VDSVQACLLRSTSLLLHRASNLLAPGINALSIINLVLDRNNAGHKQIMPDIRDNCDQMMAEAADTSLPAQVGLVRTLQRMAAPDRMPTEATACTDLGGGRSPMYPVLQDLDLVA